MYEIRLQTKNFAFNHIKSSILINFKKFDEKKNV